jgi:hypothetical protein
MLRVSLTIGFLCVIGFAQNSRSSCVDPDDIRNLTLREVRTRIDPGSDDFFLYKRLLDLTPERPKPGILAPLFETDRPANSGCDRAIKASG